MPWTVGDVESKKKGLSDEGKRKWVKIANSVYHDCRRKGGSDSHCAKNAIMTANSRT